MNARKAKALEDQLKRLTYGDIAKGLAEASIDVLLELLDSKSIKVGDTAADFLVRKKGKPLVISAILENQIRTKLGKIRAENILFGSGRDPEVLPAHIKLMQDRNDEVADNALLALVAWGNREFIPLIKTRQSMVKSPKDAKRFELACEAIEKSDLSIFSPHVTISKEVWMETRAKK